MSIIIKKDQFEPEKVEKSKYKQLWRKIIDKSNEKSYDYVFCLPCPNVTGTLHLGHALTCSIQDAIARYQKMKGNNVLWVPGTDHAGIATQVVVEKHLMKELGKTRHDFTREEFIQHVWDWKAKKGSTINSQLEKMGATLNWSKEVFTMDTGMSRAVIEAFVQFHEKGLIKRDTRLINWDCHLETAISNCEVKHKELDQPTKIPIPGYARPVQFGMIWNFAYKVIGADPNEFDEIVFATTRPETMLGDVAVAVHPDDKRYVSFHGKKLVHPFSDREIPIILDDTLVDPNLGTGCVKVTPAHDPHDYECGKRHDLKFIDIFDDKGNIAQGLGLMWEGEPRFEVRWKIIKYMKDLGQFRGNKAKKMTIGICDRSGDVVEPRVKPQWFLDCRQMSAKAAEAVRNGDLQIIPKVHEPMWFRFLENTEDWCISRQLIWGHQVPAWLLVIASEPDPDPTDMNNWIIARNLDEAIQIVKKRGVVDSFELVQDPDVLDTWFSSGLYPFSALGWPDKSPNELPGFPNSLLETGYDILYFWVARMVMMSLELTGQLPFPKVLLHGLVRDAKGEKMSKSKGNVIDPIDVIQGISLKELNQQLIDNPNLNEKQTKEAIKYQKEMFPQGIPKFGTDTLRFVLVDLTRQDISMNLDLQVLKTIRHFCNKVWNIFKFVKMVISEEPDVNELSDTTQPIDEWIMSRLHQTIKINVDAFENLELHRATHAIRHFLHDEFASVYLEAIKGRTNQISVHLALRTCLETGLKLLHPFMPYLTDHLWHELEAAQDGSILETSFPEYHEKLIKPELEKDISEILEIVTIVRNEKQKIKTIGQVETEAAVEVPDDKKEFFAKYTKLIAQLAKVGNIVWSATQTAAGGLEINVQINIVTINN